MAVIRTDDGGQDMTGQERCARCGEVDTDRRTLWMSCLYKMDELDVPFETQDLYLVPENEVKSRIEPQSYFTIRHHLDTDKTERTEGDYHKEIYFVDEQTELNKKLFYKLRVCKQCRGDWMGAIEAWFLKSDK